MTEIKIGLKLLNLDIGTFVVLNPSERVTCFVMKLSLSVSYTALGTRNL